MFFPIGDTPNPRDFKPWVNWTLIGINIAVFVLVTLPLGNRPIDPYDPSLREYVEAVSPALPANISPRQFLGSLRAYDLFTFSHGYKPGAPEVSDLLFSLFLHGGFMHLFGNMLFLWIYGDNVEHRLGRIGYLVTYLLSGIAATEFFALFARSSLIPLVGASGAISGVLGLYFVLFPRNKVKVFIALFPIYFDRIELPARWVLGAYLVIDNLFPFLFGAHSNVAHGAHIGGFLAGLGVAVAGERLAWQWPWSGRLQPSPASPGAAEPPPISLVGRLQSAIEKQDPATALNLAARATGHDLARLAPRECTTLAQWLDRAGHPVAASRLLRACLSRHARSGDLAEVYLELGHLRLQQGQVTSAYQHLLDALDHDPAPATRRRILAALQQIDGPRK